MNWFHLKLCLIVVILLSPYFTAANEDHTFNLNSEDELVPSEQIIDNNDVASVEKKVSSAQPVGNHLKQSFIPNLSRNIERNTGFQLPHGLFSAPFVGNPFDAQASSATNNVLLVLNNDKNKLAELTRPAEESLKRLTRNPDVVDDIVGQFQQLGGGVTQQLLQQVGQSAPELSKSFGQALNEALSQTNILAQAAPGNFDFGQLGQSLSQSFISGAAQNLFNPAGATQAAAEETEVADAGAEAKANASGAAAAPQPEPEPEPEAPAAPEAPKNPFDQIVGSALIPQLPQFGQLPPLPQLPLGLLGPLAGLSTFLPLGSEMSEVRVMPDQYSPYKLSPKPVDHQTMAEMRLKAVLRDALNKKTIPILWFHLPANQDLQKTTEDLEMEAKLEIFEKQVIAELKQLQELSKLANEVKRAQLERGVKPTVSLTTKLNLYEIPIYDITLGDIERTLKDEHVIILMQTIVQNQNKQFHKHHQATTKYLTDLTGAPTKRQTKTAEDALKSMEKDDMMKMMTYAYRMAAMHGHEMPWLKNDKITDTSKSTLTDQQRHATEDNMPMTDGHKMPWHKNDKITDTSKSTLADQQRHATEDNMPMIDERQWLEDKQRQMAAEAEKQRQIAEERKQNEAQNKAWQWADSTMQQFKQQQPIERQWADPNTMHHQMPIQHQMLPPQMSIHRQMLPLQIQQPMQIQQHPHMQQWHQQDIQRQMMQQQSTMNNFDMPPQMPVQRQWVNPTNMQQQPMMADPSMQPMHRQWADANIPETKSAIKIEQQPEQRHADETHTPQTPEQTKLSEEAGALKKTEKLPEQRQWIDTKTAEQTVTKTDTHMPHNTERMDNMPVVGEATPQMAENAGKARKGMKDLFDELDVFDHGKHKGNPSPPTIINYYYNTGGSRYPPVYAPGPSAVPQSYGGYAKPPPPPPSYGPAGGYGGGYAMPAPPQSSYPVAPQYKPAGGQYGGYAHGSNAYGSYRSATGDEEIAAMLQQNQQMPKMMMMMPHEEEPTSHTTATENDINNAEDHTKRLANKQIETNSGPAAYIIVMKTNTSKSHSKSRRKRSTEYATLEPIDENSLEALRKTYKNSLKEITLNPNETPAEALMRYNAESIREALLKANKQPMEISAGGEEHDEVKQGQITHEVEQQQQQPIHQQLPLSYALNNNNQYLPVTAAPQSQISNGPYITYPMPVQQTQTLTVPYNSQDATYNPSANQGGFYNNYISKYNDPTSYSNNNNMPVTPNPFLSMYNSLESVPYIDDYSMINQPYQEHIGKPYTQPQFTYNQLSTPSTKSSNVINKNVQHIYTSGNHLVTDYNNAKSALYGKYASDMSSGKTHYPFSNKLHKNSQISTYSPARQLHTELRNHYKSGSSQETSSFDQLIAVIKQRLTQCCNECKDNILKGLDETLKRKHYGNEDKLKILEINVKPYGDKPHTVSYRNPGKEEDFKYQQWLTEMSEKGYDKSYLTKQHQREYLKDGKPNLHIAEEEGLKAPEEEKVFDKNNQSYKRETTVPQTEVEAKTEAEIVETPIKIENSIEKLEEEEDEEQVEAEEEEVQVETEPEPELEEVVVEVVTEKNISVETKNEKTNKNIKKPTEMKKTNNENKYKVLVKKEKPDNVNTTESIETAEATTHSVYALRGKFRPYTNNPKTFVLKQGKQFDNYKNINKLGSGNIIAESYASKNTVDKSDKLEEILDILHDLSKHTKDKIKESSNEDSSKATTTLDNTNKLTNSTPTLVSVSSTSKPLTTSTTASANGITQGTPKKINRRRARLSSKSRKLVDNSATITNLHLESIK